jgi:biotin transport system substrate-specific component
MAKSAIQTLSASQERIFEGARQVALVVGGSLLVALCAHITIPLPGTPVPLKVQNFGVLLVGLLLGSRRGFAALALYLAEGAMGMPVFSPTGPGGIAQLLGPTGGFCWLTLWWRGWRVSSWSGDGRVLLVPWWAGLSVKLCFSPEV